MNFQKKYNNILNYEQENIKLVLKNMMFGIVVQEPLKSKLFELLNAPSKHIRPLVSFLYLKALGEKIDDAQVLYQSAIELVHNASLIHDDVIDDSKVRRSLPTLNSQFGNKLAVMTGDYLLSRAMQKVLDIGNLELVKLFSDTLEVMSSGEISQHFGKFQIPTIEEYIKKSEQKTAKLFETAVCGSLLVAEFGSHPESLSEDSLEFYACAQNDKVATGKLFAKNFGIAFQIRDDLINCKTTNTDISDGIYTAPVIFSGDTKVTSDAIEKTKSLLNNYIDEALKCLSKIDENEYKLALVELLELMRDA